MRISLLHNETWQPTTFPGRKTHGSWVIPNEAMEFILLWLWKVCKNTTQPLQMTKLKRQGLYQVYVHTSSLLSSGSHGKSRRVTLRIGFFSGSLNGLGSGLRVRVHSLTAELSYKGVPLVFLCGLCQSIYAVKWTESDKWKGLMEGFDEINNKGTKTSGPVCQLAQSLQSYCTF